MNCENRKKGRLCGREKCKPCFKRSFASCENSKYLKEGQESPLLLARSSAKKIWFECPKCKHSFETVLYSVSNGHFCPFCSNQKLCSSDECKTCFEKSFASSDKSEFWSVEKNKRFPREVFASSNKKYWFGCPKCKHSFEASLDNVSNGKFCPFCSSTKLCSSDECKPCFEKSFASSDKAKFWNTEKNKQSPREVFAGSDKKFWFDCEKCKHSFEMGLCSVSNGHFCPFCSSQKLCSSNECKICFEKSFASSNKAEFWSTEKNKQSPREVFANSGKKFWFECGKCKHSFEIRLACVSNGSFCPFCSNKQLCSSDDCKTCFEKSFASSNKAEFWSTEKNKQSPREVAASSNKKFWFECEKKHKFSSALNHVSSGRWCPKCKNKTETKLLSFLEENFEDPIHQFKVSWCKNPETNKFLPFDFCVSKIIIELDGRQHYEQVVNWQSPELTQKSDRYKEEQANKNGYSVLRILQKDVWEDKIDWKKLLLEYIKDYEIPIVKNLWETSE
uniref:Restriction endonuclease n=1 Tax=Marseillevirus sp. TaxID=2809551 RepID=A0AA96EM49_9VIRU|nr:restriction endonuclease [Marseillevirus sp.]